MHSTFFIGHLYMWQMKSNLSPANNMVNVKQDPTFLDVHPVLFLNLMGVYPCLY